MKRYHKKGYGKKRGGRRGRSRTKSLRTYTVQRGGTRL